MTNIETVIVSTRLELITRYLDNLNNFSEISLED